LKINYIWGYANNNQQLWWYNVEEKLNLGVVEQNQQLLGYNVEKLHLGVREQKTNNFGGTKLKRNYIWGYVNKNSLNTTTSDGPATVIGCCFFTSNIFSVSSKSSILPQSILYLEKTYEIFVVIPVRLHPIV
jgi:hypothetical protein